MFSLALMSKGEKRCGLDAIVGGISRTMQPFRVAINAKGGDFWHVYRESVLVIDGKNINDDGMFTGAMRKAAMMENMESISSGEEANNMKIKAQEE
jgi:hypothetical protein